MEFMENLFSSFKLFEFYDNCRNSRVFIALFLLSICGQTLEFESERERAIRQFVIEK